MSKHQVLIDVTNNSLDAISHLLEKADEYVKSGKISEKDLLNASIAPDMFNFKKQIQLVSDITRGTLARLSEKERVAMDDIEETLDELKARIQKTKDVIKDFKVEDMVNSDDLKISLPWMGGMHIEGKDFIAPLGLSNLVFHVTTAYNILRKEGVALGKLDFMQGLKMKK
jgi:uncharacterized protein